MQLKFNQSVSLGTGGECNELENKSYDLISHLIWFGARIWGCVL